MGIVRKPSIKMYWGIDEHIAILCFNSVVSRNMYEMVIQSFHLNHDENRGDDRLLKVRPYDIITRRFSSVYVPDQYICVDESLTLYKGRLIFKQWQQMKTGSFWLEKLLAL